VYSRVYRNCILEHILLSFYRHYANVAHTTNDQDIQGQGFGEDDSSKTQYTALDDFSREKRDNLYDAIKKD
jgi:hypothetical protein